MMDIRGRGRSRELAADRDPTVMRERNLLRRQNPR